jgi:tetratricopeptide (TPR) repeat protein
MARLGVPVIERLSYLEENLPKINLSDDLTLELVKANNAAGKYTEAVNILLNHVFVPGEGGEHALAEQFMFAKFAAGRKALVNGDIETALGLFRETQKIPENLHAGLWNNSVLAPYRYFEAEALSKLGKTDEAKELVNDIMKDSNSGMWNMGGEFAYYTARCAELSGNYMKAREIMRRSISGWEHALESKDGGITAATPFFLSFCDDSMRAKKANLTYLLGYGKLYHNDIDGAKKLFAESLRLNPDNISCALELEILS